MVKKKAVKHIVKRSKTLHPNKTHKISAKKVQEIVETPKVEEQKIEIPKVEEKIVETPKTEEKKVDIPEVEKEADEETRVPGEIHIQASDEALAEVGSAVKRKHEFHFGKYVLILIVILVIAFIVLSVQQTTYSKIVRSNVTRTVDVPQNTSFGNLLGITDVNYNEKVKVLGYLYYERIQKDAVTKKDTYYVVDDTGNKIKLLFGYYESKLYDNLFILGNLSKETYNVSGTYNYNYDGFVIEVSNITLQNKEIVQATTNVMQDNLENVTGTSLNFSYAIKRVFG